MLGLGDDDKSSCQYHAGDADEQAMQDKACVELAAGPQHEQEGHQPASGRANIVPGDLAKGPRFSLCLTRRDPQVMCHNYSTDHQYDGDLGQECGHNDASPTNALRFRPVWISSHMKRRQTSSPL